MDQKTTLSTRDVPDFGSGSGRSRIWQFSANPLKSGSGHIEIFRMAKQILHRTDLIIFALTL